MSDETLKAVSARLNAIEALVAVGRNDEALTLLNRLICLLPSPGDNNTRCAQAEINQLAAHFGREAIH